MKLSNITSYGRYKNKETNKAVNVKRGYNKQRGTEHLFYLYRGKRVFISQADFYGGKYEKQHDNYK